MKKIIYIIASLMLIQGCTGKIVSEMEDANSYLENKIDQNSERIALLEEACKTLNQNVTALQQLAQAMQENDFVKEVTPIKDEAGNIIGYNISMLKAGDMQIYNGVDGEYPVITIKKDSEDNVYYWCLNGEWMLADDGNRIVADAHDGISPMFKIEEGYWYISVDNGASWKKSDASKGKDGHSFFSDLVLNNNLLVLTLADGTVINVPRYVNPELTFNLEDDEAGATSGIEVYINYEIKNYTEGSSLTATSDGNYAVRVKPTSESGGYLIVTPPAEYCDGFINVILSDIYGFSTVKVINFHENKIEFAKGLEYQISHKGGELIIPFKVNFDYDVRVDDEWISLEQDTKAEMSDCSLRLNIGANFNDIARQGRVYIYSKDNQSQPYATVVINQASAVINVSQSLFTLSWDGGHISIDVYSDYGLKVASQSDWISYSVTNVNDYNFKIDAAISSNRSHDKRTGNILLFDKEGKKVLGTIEINQSAEFYDEDNDLIFTVRANYPNDFTAELPLAGEIDCFVEWGDGTVEHYQSSPVKHTYGIKDPESFVVKVYGKVTALSSYNINTPCIVKVNQWGRTGLTSMDQAFRSQTLLESIAGNRSDAFSEVESFNNAFSNCIRLTSIPDNLFDGAVKAEYFSYVFDGCILIEHLFSSMFKDCVMMKEAGHLFTHCTSLKEIPYMLFKNNVNLTNISAAFEDCSNIVSVPEDLFVDCKKLSSIDYLFNGCENLRNVPVNIFDNNLNLASIFRAFFGCPKLYQESPYSIVNGKKYHLYERNELPDYFQAVINMGELFGNGTWEVLTDRDMIPEECR